MDENRTNINYSANESELLGLKVGRCVAENFNEDQLLQQVLEGEYDICRLTVPASDENTVAKLEKTGLPYYYSGSITRYKTRIADLPERAFIHDDLEYEKYDGTQDELLLQLLIGTWGTYPIGYYRTPFLNHLVTKEQEIVCVCEFYKKHNLQKDYPNNTIMFIRHGENYVGFFALNIIDDRLESHIGGIVDPYREGGYFFDMQEYIRRFCVSNNLTYFCFGARNENRRVNGIFQKFGYRAVDADNVFHIASLLSYTEQQSIHDDWEIKEENTSAIYSSLLGLLRKNTAAVLKDPALNSSFHINDVHKLMKGKYKVTTTFPVIAGNECMVTLKVYDKKNTLLSFAYFLAL